MRQTFFLLVFAAVSLPTTSGSAGTDSIDAKYDLGADLRGSIAGSCGTSGILVAEDRAGAAVIESAGGRFIHYTVEMNETRTPATGGTVLSGRVKTIETEIPAGRTTAAWDQAGRVLLTGADGFSGRPPQGFGTQFKGDEVSTGVVQSRIYLATTYQELPTGVLWPSWHHLNGVQRAVSVSNGTVEANGDVTLYAEQISLMLPDGSKLVLPDHYERVAQSGSPDVGEVFVGRLHYGILTFNSARASLPVDGTTVWCRGLEAAVDGELELRLARGTIRSRQADLRFEEQELGLVGKFDWREEIEGSGVRVTGNGQLRSASVDFASVIPGNRGPSFAEIGLWAAVVAGVGSIVYFASKGIFAFFSRLTDSRLTLHPGRAMVLETVKANPNVTLRGLAASTGMHSSVVRYHTRLLETRGLLRSHRVEQDRCFVAKDTLREQGRGLLKPSRDLVLRNDPALSLAVRSVPAQGIRLHELYKKIMVEFGLSKPGAWKVVVRAEEKGFVTRVQVGREVWIRCAS